MNWFKNMLFGDEKSQIGSLVNNLTENEKKLHSLVSEKKAMEQKNPFIGKLGIMMGMGSPPPGFESTINAGEERFSNLVNKISNTEKENTRLKTKLKEITEQDFKTSSEWNEWLNKSYKKE
jgi:hypothetical protein